MPILPGLDAFPYVGQEEGSLACVPACVDMVCQFWDLAKSWSEIVAELDYSVDDGTPFSNVAWLSGVRVLPVVALRDIRVHLANAPPHPVIANLYIQGPEVLGYTAQVHMLHAVVVVGIEAEQVTFFDPLSLVQRSTTDPTECDLYSFEDAWLGGWVILPW